MTDTELKVEEEIMVVRRKMRSMGLAGLSRPEYERRMAELEPLLQAAIERRDAVLEAK